MKYLKFTFIFILLISLIAINVFSQIPKFDKKEWQRRQQREVISQIVDGETDSAIRNLLDYLKDHPLDQETLFALTVAHAQKKEITTAMAYLKEAVVAGLPFERFIAGPRDLLLPLFENDEFQKIMLARSDRLIHGPMLGGITDSSAKFWLRTAKEFPVYILVKEVGKKNNIFKSTLKKTKLENDFTTILEVPGLESQTNYKYEIFIDGMKETGNWIFNTYPSSGKKAKFKIAFGGGAAYTPQFEKVWNLISGYDLSGFLFLGDNVYIDNPTRPAVQSYCYYRRQSRPEFREFTATTPIYAIWDDHDFVDNDKWGGPEIDKPEWKIPVWKLFKNNWNNSYYGGGDSNPGCWFDFSVGDVDFFMLDGRYYRTDPKEPNQTMLGPTQKKWLFQKLQNSKATFKVIASAVPWASGTKPGSLDTWDGYKTEREELFSFIAENKIEGIILLSADRHRSDVWKIFRPRGYHLYEFESSCLTNIHRHNKIKGALFSYNEKRSFGLLAFDTSRPDPEVTYKIINIDNEVVHNFKIKKSQLTVKSPAQLEWEKLISEGRLRNPAFAFVEEVSTLPRVLLIGNSISIGYTVPVRKLLKGNANVFRIPENGGATWRGLEKLTLWLGTKKWDVIHFNWGLHDLKYFKNGRLDISGEQISTLKDYENNLDILVKRLKNTGAKLIWASTTPVPDSSSGRIVGDEIKYNAVAKNVMNKHGIKINDLHNYITPYLAEYQRRHNVHFTNKGYQFLGKKVAEEILKRIEEE